MEVVHFKAVTLAGLCMSLPIKVWRFRGVFGGSPVPFACCERRDGSEKSPTLTKRAWGTRKVNGSEPGPPAEEAAGDCAARNSLSFVVAMVLVCALSTLAQMQGGRVGRAAVEIGKIASRCTYPSVGMQAIAQHIVVRVVADLGYFCNQVKSKPAPLNTKGCGTQKQSQNRLAR